MLKTKELILLYTTDIAHSRLQNSIVQLILGDDKEWNFFPERRIGAGLCMVWVADH